MSKIIKLLNEAQQGLAPGTDPAGACPRKLTPKGPVPATTNLYWLIGLILCIVLFTNLGLTLKLLMMAKNSTLINTLQVNAFSTDFEKFNTNLSDLSLRTQDTNARVTQLEKDSEIQTTAVDNLRKAKDTLFNRLSSIEGKQDQHE